VEGNIRNEIKEGDVVSLKCGSISKNGIPHSAVIYRIRNDMTWREVVSSNPLPRKKSVNGRVGHHFDISVPLWMF
jgi:hypothetical protein